MIINTGIMLERLTNGRIPIGWHRVVAAPGYEGERYSVVQFCHPRPWTVLSPVPSCCTPETPQRFAAISAADALDEVLYQINLVEDARASTTEFPPTTRVGPTTRRPYLDEPTEQLEPPSQFAPAILAIDIGGTSFEAGPGDGEGRARRPHVDEGRPRRRPEAHFANLAAIVEQQMELADRHDLASPPSVSVARDRSTGNCETVSPVNSPAWREFPPASGSVS